MIVVSDTTPIISLIKINRLDLLKELFNEVLIPDAVFRELTTNTVFTSEAQIVKSSSFLKVSAVQNHKALQLLQEVSGLDDGESEAIILADELKDGVLVIDEKKGRKVAQKMGIPITGTVGILIQAYNEQKVSADEIRSYLTQLKNSNIRLSDSLIQQALDLL